MDSSKNSLEQYKEESSLYGGQRSREPHHLALERGWEDAHDSLVGVTCYQLHQSLSTETEVHLEAECLTSFWRRKQEAVWAHTSAPKLHHSLWQRPVAVFIFPLYSKESWGPPKSVWIHEVIDMEKGLRRERPWPLFCRASFPWTPGAQDSRKEQRGKRTTVPPISSSIHYWRSARAAQSAGNYLRSEVRRVKRQGRLTLSLDTLSSAFPDVDASGSLSPQHLGRCSIFPHAPHKASEKQRADPRRQKAQA